MKRYLFFLCLGVFLLEIGQRLKAEEECNNISFLFTPVHEEFVDELPESIREFPIKSMMPVVFRGGAKNWNAMEWTPDLLRELGFSFGRESREVNSSQVFIKKSQRKATNQKLSDLLERDTRFREDYRYSPEFYQSDYQYFAYSLLSGPAGFKQTIFDEHEAALLAQFEGERLVLLLQPEKRPGNLVNCINNALSKDTDAGMTVRDAVMKMIDNEEYDELVKDTVPYSPLQRVILKPGDVLYIPSGWGHRVFYLKNSIGVAQQIYNDNANWMND